MNKYKTAVLLLTDKSTVEISELFYELKYALNGVADVFVAYHNKEKMIPESIKAVDNFIFDNSILSDLGYKPIEAKLVPGSNHFPILKFYLQNNDYNYYCIVEDDVRFTGNWNILFNMINDFEPDFISCSIRHFHEEPTWSWWHSLKYNENSIRREKCLASFNPIYGISNRALQFVDHCLRIGWKGHHEILLPTLLKYGGYNLVDFGGDGNYVPNGYENIFYYSPNTKSIKNFIPTMRYRPIMSEVGHLKNKLYHPIKDFSE